MTKIKSTKRALLMSALTLLVCVSMLVGTTFAWFTDSVTSTNNIIKSGNLDVELEYLKVGKDGQEDVWTKVTETTNVFEENTLWEPGHTEVVYLKVSNKGSLALKYNLGVNIVNEIESINVAGEPLRLSNYIEFGAIENVSTPYADRAVARAAVTDAKVLSTGYTKAGSIEAGADAQYVALVVYMPETIGNEANYRTGEVAPEITLGINLMATQYTSEKDSFDEKYDENATFGAAPVARVTTLAEMPEVTTANGIYTLDTAYVFNTTEDYASAQLNAHRYWHADFVAYFDQDVDGDDMGLAGQYDKYSEDWLAFELTDMEIKANTPVRMLDYAGISMNYEELCLHVKEFSCGAFAVNPEAMAGKTMTVELRLFETLPKPHDAHDDCNGNSQNCETGKYITIGSYSYTFDAIEVANQTEFDKVIANGTTAVELGAGEYILPATSIKANGALTVTGTKDTVIDLTNGTYVDGASVAFNGVTIKSALKTLGSGDYAALYASNVTYTKCTFDGALYVGRDNTKFVGCTFNMTAKDNSNGNADYIWTLGMDVSFENCIFNTDGKAVLVYAHGIYGTDGVSNVTVKGCTFKATKSNKAGAIANQNCAAIEIDNSYDLTVNVVASDNTVDEKFSGEWRIKTKDPDTKITVNGTEYTQLALDGKLMTIDANQNVTVIE